MTVDIVKFQPEHARALTVVANHGEAYTPDWSEATAMLASRAQQPSYTFIANGEVLAVCGIIPIHRARAAVWAAIGQRVIDSSPATVAREARKIIKRMHAEGYTRLEAEIPAEWYVNLRFADWLGFKLEGLLQKAWPDGTDAYMMARCDNATD